MMVVALLGRTGAVREEPGKHKPRSCLAQELARNSAQEKLTMLSNFRRRELLPVFRGKMLTLRSPERALTQGPFVWAAYSASNSAQRGNENAR